MQTSQSAKRGTVAAGMVRGHESHHVIDGDRVATVSIPFGRFCSAGASGSQAKLPTSASEVTTTGLGFARRDASKAVDATTGAYAAGDAVPIVRRSPGVWAYAEEALGFGDPVFVRHTVDSSGTGTQERGTVRNDAYTGTQCTQLPGARVEQACTGIGPVLISIGNGAVSGAQGAQGATGAQGAQGVQGAQGAAG